MDLHTDRVEQAEAHFHAAIALRPGEPTYYFALGVALMQQSECGEARTQFSQDLTLKPELTQAREQREKCEAAA